MAGIGAIGGGASPYLVTTPRQSAEPIGSSRAGALGNKSGLGESTSSVPVRDEGPDRASGIGGTSKDLSEEDQKEVAELKRRDQEVRQHEQAHVAAAGRYANGGPKFEFTVGPDGRQYATGGEVSIDVSPASTPEATIQKAQTIRRAALAPAEPSGQDRSVANAASKLESDARRELQEARQAEANGDGDSAAGSEETDEVASTRNALQPPPALRRELSQYRPDADGGGVTGGGVVGGVGVLWFVRCATRTSESESLLAIFRVVI